jgi:hypothetical protein
MAKVHIGNQTCVLPMATTILGSHYFLKLPAKDYPVIIRVKFTIWLHRNLQ